jgi:hypothetical protein
MKIEVKLITTRSEKVEGFPLIVEISHRNIRKTKTIAFCHEKHFIVDGATISEKHPDYDILAPIMMNLYTSLKTVKTYYIAIRSILNVKMEGNALHLQNSSASCYHFNS